MGSLRCPKCGRHLVRRSHRTGVVERLLSGVSIYPFRCQLCGSRFRALQGGKRYVVRSGERREYVRVGLRARAAVVSDRGDVECEVTELSMEGCTVTTPTPLGEGATVRAELHVLPGEPPVAVEAAVVHSVRGTTCGLHFARVAPEEGIRLRGVVAGLLRGQHDAAVPEGPEPAAGRLRSVGFWLTVALVVLLALAVAMLSPFPLFSLCTYGVNC